MTNIIAIICFYLMVRSIVVTSIKALKSSVDLELANPGRAVTRIASVMCGPRPKGPKVDH